MTSHKMKKGKGKIPLTRQQGTVDVLKRLDVLNRRERHAVLATDDRGQPYTSLVAYALTPDARGALFATPKKSTKYRNILRNRKVSLMIDTRSNTPRGYLEADAVTIIGTASPLRKGLKRQHMADLFLKKHPRLRDFVRADSTVLVFVSVNRVIHAGRFQMVTEWSADAVRKSKKKI